MDHHRFAVDLDHAAGGFAHAEDQLRQLGATGPDQPRQPDDFTGANLQTARQHFFAICQVVHVQTRAAERNIALFVKQIAERAAHHHAHQLRGIQLVARQAADVQPVAQDADAVRELIHFRHPVADVDNRHPFIAQAQNQFEQTVGFARREGGGGFIHHQNTAVAVQRAGDLHLLLLGDGQLHDQVGGAELRAQTVNDRLRLGSHLFALDQPAARQLAAEKNVFRHGQVRSKLHLLINQGNACGQRILRTFDVKRLTVDEDVAAAGGIGACEDLHQRAFSGAVFPHQRVDLSGENRQIHTLERVEIAKRLGNVAHL